MLIGITGLNASGKDTVAEYLKERGFYHFSLSDVLRQELRKQKKPLTRDNLIAIGNEMRKAFGPQILAELALKQVQDDKNYVITSIRNPSEVKLLKARRDFLFITVKSSVKTRYERLQQRGEGRDKKIKTLKQFKDIEAKELKSDDPTKQQLLACIKQAEVVVSNDAGLEELHNKINRLLQDWMMKKQQIRPSWDAYFMNIAKTVAARSNCMKRHVAAVIVKDKRIVSTGYNGTPRGVKNCNEGGCARCNSFAKSGTNLSECFCSHGEENAIVQASYHGASLKDATIYTTFSPCLICSKMIINSGITHVVYNVGYPLGETSQKLLKNAGIKLRQFKVE